jgi:hypothetical protein
MPQEPEVSAETQRLEIRRSRTLFNTQYLVFHAFCAVSLAAGSLALRQTDVEHMCARMTDVDVTICLGIAYSVSRPRLVASPFARDRVRALRFYEAQTQALSLKRVRAIRGGEETRMIESIDARLREIGILDQDVQTRLDGKEKALVITHQDLMYVDSAGVQRTPLRFVTKVVTDKVGSLTVRSSNGPNIEGNIRGFDVTELKVFFEGIKGAIARAKAEHPSSDAPAGLAAASPLEPARAEMSSSEPALGATGAPFSGEPDFGGPSTSIEPTIPALTEPMPQVPADPWDNFSTPRPTLEIPPSARLADDFDDFRLAPPSEAGVASKDTEAFDWDDPVPTQESPRPVVPSLSAQAMDDEPMLEADDVDQPSFTPSPASTSTPGVAVTAGLAGAGAASAVPKEVQPASAAEVSRVLETVSNAASRVPTLAESYAISPISRWLKFMAIPLGLIGIAAGGLSVPATDNVQIMQWVQVVAFIVGGLAAALISYGIGDLLSIWGALAADIRAMRRNQLGH